LSTRPANARAARPRPAKSGRSAQSRRRAQRARASQRRRRLFTLVLTILVSGGLAAVVLPHFGDKIKQITLPLRHEDIIRQQARDKDLDPALIAGVIYAESHFRDGQVSSAGALGLMQLTPETAKDIARRSGGSGFGIKDLGTAQVNISYGAYYLRYLKQRFAGNTTLMLAAYNAGEGNVDRWISEAAQAERDFGVSDIPFPETRAYVQKVLDARRDYRANYASELGLG
jgi:soluble lytic murein transglycosylase